MTAPQALRPAADVAVGARRALLRLAATQSVHLGSSLSVVDILVAVHGVMRLTPEDLTDPDRDRLILSKGHAVWALYAVLSELGLLDLGPGRLLPGHPADGTPGVDAATGALGHGLSIGAGLAMAARLHGRAHRTFVVLGDGELNEGSVWEAAMFAAHRRLGRLTAIVDVNGMQQEGRTADVLDLAPLDDKWRAFGWNVATVDGHDHAALTRCLPAAADGDRPTVVLARTVKGRGVSFMEHSAEWHVGSLTPDLLSTALRGLGDPAPVAHG
ncbi:transketolase [Dactylosporangium sp. NBC_01737]|uniref:transketolase n=1 Tax=Dactylosporangium sp. NBC_01737 TaxID=2975959 RepID=UPI002E0E98A5|nr:transketolase [Dactylosporangium sp. NBC_01737]